MRTLSQWLSRTPPKEDSKKAANKAMRDADASLVESKERYQRSKQRAAKIREVTQESLRQKKLNHLSDLTMLALSESRRRRP